MSFEGTINNESSHLDRSTGELAPFTEKERDVFPESRRVIVAHRPSVTESLQDRVGLEDPVFDGTQLAGVPRRVAEDGKILRSFEKAGRTRVKRGRGGGVISRSSMIPSLLRSPVASAGNGKHTRD